jgi:bifunctional UDP-N-acetylglucosamine pyrophosphorylase / glucosamine-1-phosphate N-acetyltransferase
LRYKRAIQDSAGNGLFMTGIAIIVLAAGMGTRMKSARPKVLHKAANRSLLGHVLAAATELKPLRTVVIHGPGMDDVVKEAQSFVPDAQFAEQTERRGTGHAVAQARQAIKFFAGTVLILYGDVPLIRAASLRKLVAKVNDAQPMSVLGFTTPQPKGYGRLLVNAREKVTAIREELDASPEERDINLCNSGIIAISAETLWKLLPEIKPNNAKNEIYLTDLVELVNKSGRNVGLEVCDEDEVQGVNDRVQLSQIEARLQARYREAAQRGGATLIDPATTYFSADTVLGSDVLVEPNVFFGPGVSVSDNVEILAHCHIEGTTIAKGARIGPFARLRPGAEIGENAHVGNYVEIKKSVLGKGAKVNHLSYIGDADIGAKSNIGAGTITCNYDGYDKHRTVLGENVFVGSNTALVAPVKVGNGANIAAGSVVTREVPEDALAITRPEMKIKDGWAKTYRAIKAAKKAKKTEA